MSRVARRHRVGTTLTSAVLGAVLSACVPAGPVADGSGGAVGGLRLVQPNALEEGPCRAVPPGDMSSRQHLDPSLAPPASELYDVPLPAGGDHLAQWLPLQPGLPEVAIDPRGVLHNMEHGSVVVWIDPDVVGPKHRRAIAQWQLQLAGAGFANADPGSGIFVSLMPPDADVGVGIAYRAWGVAVDCVGWNPVEADAFVAEHFGSRGDAPEAGLGPYPDDNAVLRDAGDTTSTV